jgi:hypothetical protein
MISVKLQLVLFTAVLTILVSAPATYEFTNAILGAPLGIPFAREGSPTPTGLFAHAVIAAALMFGYLQTFRV